MKHDYTINGDSALYSTLDEIQRLYKEHRYLTIRIDTGKQRTGQQNRALHKWLGILAQTLNDAGLDMKKVIKQEVEIPWSTDSAKDYLWRPIQNAVIGKQSTVDAERTEYNEVYEVLCRHLSQKFGIEPPPWPHREEE